jgi:hypothetical protein
MTRKRRQRPPDSERVEARRLALPLAERADRSRGQGLPDDNLLRLHS